MCVGTFIHADAHGTNSGISDSYTTSVISWADYSTMISQTPSSASREVPFPNLVVAFACATMSSDTDTTAAKAFHVVTSGGATIADKAYVGFASPFVSCTWLTSQGSTPDFRVSKREMILYDQLKDGKSVAFAITEANQFNVYNVLVIGASDPPNVELFHVGDGRCRVKKVYTTLAEEFKYGDPEWYFVYQP